MSSPRRYSVTGKKSKSIFAVICAMVEWMLLKFAKCLVVGSETSPVVWDTFESSEQLPLFLKITYNGMLTVRHGNSVLEVGDLRGSEQIQAHHQNGSLLVLTQIKANVVRKWRGLFMGKDNQKQCEICYSMIKAFISEKRQLSGLTGSQSVPTDKEDLPSDPLRRECPTPDNVLEPLELCKTRNMYSMGKQPQGMVQFEPNNLLKQKDLNESAIAGLQPNWFRISQNQSETVKENIMMNESNPCVASTSNNVKSCSRDLANVSCINNNKQTAMSYNLNPPSDSSSSYVVTMENDDVIELPTSGHASCSENKLMNDKMMEKVKRRRFIRKSSSFNANAAAKKAFESITSSLKNVDSANSSCEGLNTLDDETLRQVVTKCLLDPNLPDLVSRVHSIMSNYE